MNLQSGDVISIRHYSGISPFKSIVVGVEGDLLKIKLAKEFAIMNFLEGDPVVFGFEVDDKVHVFGCNIAKINAREDLLELRVDKVESDANKRQYERYPVSLYADIRIRDSRKKQLATVKDISYYGMLIYSKAEFEMNQEIELDLFLDKAIIFLKGTVVRRVESNNFIEYGLGLKYDDIGSMNYVKEYIRRLQQEQEDAIRKMRHK